MICMKKPYLLSVRKASANTAADKDNFIVLFSENKLIKHGYTCTPNAIFVSFINFNNMKDHCFTDYKGCNPT